MDFFSQVAAAPISATSCPVKKPNESRAGLDLLDDLRNVGVVSSSYAKIAFVAVNPGRGDDIWKMALPK